MTHDYIRHGTTTLFAALNVLDGSVIGRCMPRHRHQEFIRFLNAIERAVPAGKLIHVMLDNYAAHKQPKVREMARPPSALDLPLHADLVLLAQRGRGLLRQADQTPAQRGVFHSLVDLANGHQSLLANHNQRAQTLRLESRPQRIIAAAKRGYQTLQIRSTSRLLKKEMVCAAVA